MTENIPALIAEARERTRNNIRGTNTLLARIADALEAEHQRADLEAFLGDTPEGTKLLPALWRLVGMPHSEPQGEPSDAQVQAALDEFTARINNVIQPTPGTMRAALRAAAAVNEQGENR